MFAHEDGAESMATGQENIQHETMKALLKQVVTDNPNLTPSQRQLAMDNIDRAAKQADWIMEIMRMCGYLN